MRAWRRRLKASDGIYVYKELHATDFVAGRGRIAPRSIGKYRRSQIFLEALDLVAGLPGASLFNCIVNRDEEDLAYERVLNRINRTLQPDVWNSYAMLLWDRREGRRTPEAPADARPDPIPSRYGEWPTGSFTKNIPLDRIIEDPLFKKSEQSHFIQLVDFCASLSFGGRTRSHRDRSTPGQGVPETAADLLQGRQPPGSPRHRSGKAPPQRFGRAGKQGLPPPPRTGSVLRPDSISVHRRRKHHASSAASARRTVRRESARAGEPTGIGSKGYECSSAGRGPFSVIVAGPGRGPKRPHDPSVAGSSPARPTEKALAVRRR